MAVSFAIQDGPSYFTSDHCALVLFIVRKWRISKIVEVYRLDEYTYDVDDLEGCNDVQTYTFSFDWTEGALVLVTSELTAGTVEVAASGGGEEAPDTVAPDAPATELWPHTCDDAVEAAWTLATLGCDCCSTPRRARSSSRQCRSRTSLRSAETDVPRRALHRADPHVHEPTVAEHDGHVPARRPGPLSQAITGLRWHGTPI